MSMRRTVLAATVAVAAAAIQAEVCTAAQNTQWGANYFPNVTLTTQDGAAVRFYDDLIKGKIVAINLIYTTCKFACPLETARLAQVQRILGERMGRDVFFYSITIDPEHDTPPVLKEGPLIGPDLRGVTTRRDREWLAKFIFAPDKLLADGDPIAKELFDQYKNVRMPNLALSNADAAVLVDYLAKQDAASAAPPLASAATPPPGTAAPIVEPYLRIQHALSADTLDGISDAARSIAMEAAKLGAGAASMRTAAGAFQQSGDLTSAREAFGRLTDAIVTYMKTSNASIGSNVTVAYCPMARKYWLQQGTAIRNPYYGSTMLTCGRINADRRDLSK